jgi:hypothetical protein
MSITNHSPVQGFLCILLATLDQPDEDRLALGSVRGYVPFQTC